MGLIVKADWNSTIDIYQRTSELNPRMTILSVLMNDTALSSVKALLRLGFEKYKIFDNAVLIYEEGGDDSITKICAFNPFGIEDSLFLCVSINQQEYTKNVNKIRSFMSQRLGNLNRSPLRVKSNKVFTFPQ